MAAEHAVEDLFAAAPAGLALYEVVAAVVDELGDDVEARVTKSQVTFRRPRRGFAYVWPPGRIGHHEAPAVLSVALPRHDASDRFRDVAQPRANLWMHHLWLTDVVQIDDEVRDWLAEAYDAAG